MNLGTDPLNAVRSLRGLPDWETFRAGLLEQVRKAMDEVLNTTSEKREFAAGRASALTDLHVAITAVMDNKNNHAQVTKPVPGKVQA
jgi:hypothetical protein